MNKLTRNVLVIGLSTALTLTCTGIAFAKCSAQQPKQASQNVTLTTSQSEPQENTKDETVYVLARADGSVQKIIVSDWIQNALGSATVTDETALTDIENVNGEESYTLSEETMKVWDAQGNDIYYQGSIEKALPVDLRISYQLDGAAISAQELAGKSGRVTIRFDYENRQYELVEIDGVQEKIYVPFAMLTGMLLNNDTFRNIEVSNGKLINDGDRTVVIGLAFPGMQENLGLSQDTLELPEHVEITADVTDFSLGMTVTLATNEVFSALGGANLDSADGLSEALGTLTDAMTQLTDGSSALYDGLCTLLEKSDALVSGIDQLVAGAQKLCTGAASLDDGAVTLRTKLSELSTGLSTLASNSAGLNSGAEQVFNTLLSTANAQLSASGISVPTLTIGNYSEVLTGVITSLELASPEGAQTVSALKASLDSYNAFYQGLASYTAGVDSAASGASQLTDGAASLNYGTAELKAGIDTLYDGVLTLNDGLPSLIDGITELRDGSMALSDGLRQFKEEGVDKLLELAGDELSSFAQRLKATIDVSADYRSFAGISDEMDGQVRFLYRTDEIDITES